MAIAAFTTNRTARQQNAFLVEWQNFTRPALDRMLAAGLALASAMDDYRTGQMAKVDVDRHDTYAIDHVAGLIDHLSDEVGAAKQAADALGIDPDCVDIDRAELQAALAKLQARASRPRLLEVA